MILRKNQLQPLMKFLMVPLRSGLDTRFWISYNETARFLFFSGSSLDLVLRGGTLLSDLIEWHSIWCIVVNKYFLNWFYFYSSLLNLYFLSIFYTSMYNYFITHMEFTIFGAEIHSYFFTPTLLLVYFLVPTGVCIDLVTLRTWMAHFWVKYDWRLLSKHVQFS